MKTILTLLFLSLFICSCSDSEDEINTTVLPTVITGDLSDLSITTVVSNGNVTKNGGSNIISKGICWSTNPNPTISDSKTDEGNGTGLFTSNLTGLLENTTYYIRAYATNNIGTAYGNELSFITLESLYFPPTDGSSIWLTKSIASLGWNQSAIQPLLDYLELKHSKSFIILVNGRIVMENYFNGHTATTPWYWASAGKTLTSTVTGIAEQENFLNINDKVSDYLGTGWTSETLAKENLITCRHLLTMTSGLDDAYNNSNDATLNDCVEPSCLIYSADAGTRWAYDNVYVKLQDVVASATGQTWNTFFNTKLKTPIGMTGSWIQSNNNSVYWSTTRSMARFGLLALNKGNWNGTQIINTNYFENATTTSQNINQSYGYLWWLNGKSSYHLPQLQFEFQGELIPNGANDMYMALGKDDQKIYVVPSKKLVVIRMGDAADGSNFALSDFDDALWEKINAVIN